jgi:serine/threonine protein kinase
MVVEYCAGGSCGELVRNEAPFPEQSVRYFADDLRAACHYCHSRGVIYGDISPQNILLDGSGILKLSDFALAQQVNEVGVALTISRIVSLSC